MSEHATQVQPRLRDKTPAPRGRVPAARETALFHGAMLEIEKKGAEILRLRMLLHEHGIEIPS